MKLRLIAVGQKMPDWVKTGFDEYARRLPRHLALQLIELPLGQRGRKGAAPAARAEEGEAILSQVGRASLVALDERGKAWSTAQLADQLAKWQQQGDDVALVVGGPDGLAPSVLQQARQKWSLSPLTLPHPLVRVVLAEQLYRAWTILSGHPYHRA